MNKVAISTINHSYWSYKPSALSFGGPHPPLGRIALAIIIWEHVGKPNQLVITHYCGNISLAGKWYLNHGKEAADKKK